MDRRRRSLVDELLELEPSPDDLPIHLGSDPRIRRAAACGRGAGRRLADGEHHAEGGASTDFARHVDRSTVTLYDARNQGEAEARPAKLRREERLEDPRERLS